MTAHRYWRCKVTSGPTFNAASEIEFKETSGGTDTATGGTALQDSNFSGLPAANAFDNNINTHWASNGTGTAAYIGYDHGSGVTKDIIEVTWRARNDGSFAQAPSGFDIQYSDDGSSWTTLWSAVPQTWTQGLQQTFTMPPQATLVSQVTQEVLRDAGAGTPTRVSQVTSEVLRDAGTTTPTRVSQMATEVLRDGGSAPIRTSQVAMEVLMAVSHKRRARIVN
jgi:hypothetical protein